LVPARLVKGRKGLPEKYLALSVDWLMKRRDESWDELMKLRLLLALVELVFAFALPTSAQQTNLPDPELRQQLLVLAKKFEEAWNNNDAAALAALFTKDTVLVEQAGPVYGREAIQKHYASLFLNVHFSNNLITYNDPNSPHVIGKDGNQTWENGEWSMTYQVKGADPVQIKGYHASIAVREGGVWKMRMLVSNVTLAPSVTK